MWSRWRGAAAAATLVALTALFYLSILTGELVLGDYDAFVYFYPLRQYLAEMAKQGHLPLWNPYLFLGVPFFANIQTAVLYPLNILFLWLPTPQAYSASVVTHIAIAGLTMYLFSRHCLGVSSLPALVAGTTFMLSGFMSGQVGHINQLNVSAWLPLLLLTYDKAVSKGNPALAVAAGVVATLQFLAGHTQEWYFSTATLGLFALWRATVAAPKGSSAAEGMTTRHRVRPLVYLLLAGLVEAGLSAVQLLPTLELSRQSIRAGGMSYAEATSFSLPPTVALYTLLPTYPTRLFSEYVGYVGVIPLVLAGLAVVKSHARSMSTFMLGLAMLGLFMALGGYNPFYPLLYGRVPGLDLFRVPARWLLVYTFGVSGLAGLGAEAVLQLGEKAKSARHLRSQKAKTTLLPRLAKPAAIVGITFVVLCMLLILARPRPTLSEIAVWVALAVLGLGLATLASLGRRASWVSLALLLAAATGELWLAGGNGVSRHPVPHEAYRPQRSSTTSILEDMANRKTPGRLLSFATDQYEVKETPDYKKEYAWLDSEALRQFMVDIKLSEALAPNVPMEYGIETVDGYDGGVLPLKRYAQLKELLLPVPGVPADNQLRTHLLYLPPKPLIDLLNVRYILGTKIQDTQIDNVYYDRGITRILEPGQTIQLHSLPEMMATSIGVISSTEGARQLANGVPAAALLVTDDAGIRYELPFRMGLETAETPERDTEFQPPSHRRPREVPAWTPAESDTNYYAKIPLPRRMRLREISVKSLLSGASLRIRAITLIDDVAAVSSPLVLWDGVERQLFFDMKLYINNNPLPRAFLAHQSVVRDDRQTLEMLRRSELPLDRVALLAPSATARFLYSSDQDQAAPSQVVVRSYQPEEVVLDVSASREGYLVLLDTFYPGWTAEVDGAKAPVERADYLFRAVFVQPGHHTVVFRYSPTSFHLGLRVTLATLAALLGLLVVLAARRWRRAHALVV